MALEYKTLNMRNVNPINMVLFIILLIINLIKYQFNPLKAGVICWRNLLMGLVLVFPLFALVKFIYKKLKPKEILEPRVILEIERDIVLISIFSTAILLSILLKK
jgi:hypothetical protein